jgi:CPA1 family monovalent cation:H+ antiporter
MSAFGLATVFVCLVALGGWLNARTLKLPPAVAMLSVGLAGAVALGLLRRFDPTAPWAEAVIGAISGFDFSDALLGYLLGFLLFAGAMHVDVFELRRRGAAVLSLATLGVVASTAIVGVGVWLAARALSLPLPLPWALAFGALISPTDPVAVLATLKRGQISAALRAILQGEALFNDGVGIVIFTALVAVANGAQPHPAQAILAVVLQAAGGLAIGLAAGVVVIRAMRAVDDDVVEVSLSLALAMGVYAGAQSIGLSGPIAAVGAGLLLGARRDNPAMRPAVWSHLTSFWSLVDELLNAVLFFLLGLLLLMTPLQGRYAGLAAVAIVLVLAARVVVVAPWGAYLHLRREERGASTILVCGGLHGALSVALALSLPPSPARPLILTITYAVCALSVAAQGLAFAPLAARLTRSREPGSFGTAPASPPSGG